MAFQSLDWFGQGTKLRKQMWTAHVRVPPTHLPSTDCVARRQLPLIGVVYGQFRNDRYFERRMLASVQEGQSPRFSITPNKPRVSLQSCQPCRHVKQTHTADAADDACRSEQNMIRVASSPWVSTHPQSVRRHRRRDMRRHKLFRLKHGR